MSEHVPKLPFTITLSLRSTIEAPTGRVDESVLASLVVNAVTAGAGRFELEVDGKKYDVAVRSLRDVAVSRDGNVVAQASSAT